MKTAIAILAVILVAAAQTQDDKPTPLGLAEIQQKGVEGRLGVPLGNVVEIKGTIVSGRATRRKALSSLYLLDVTEIEGKKLDNAIRLKFSVPPIANAKIASTHFGLYELKNGERPKILSSDKLAELEKGYVGSEFKLAVYESGGFSGIPNNLPEDFPAWQGTNFHFSTQMIVLKQLE